MACTLFQLNRSFPVTWNNKPIIPSLFHFVNWNWNNLRRCTRLFQHYIFPETVSRKWGYGKAFYGGCFYSTIGGRFFYGPFLLDLFKYGEGRDILFPQPCGELLSSNPPGRLTDCLRHLCRRLYFSYEPPTMPGDSYPTVKEGTFPVLSTKNVKNWMKIHQNIAFLIAFLGEKCLW